MKFYHKVTSLALACGLMLAACGGGGGAENGTGGTGITLEARATSTSSTEALVITDSSNAAATKKYEVSKYLFTATVTDGKYKGTTLTGDLMVAAKEVGSNEIKGTLLIKPTASAPASTSTTSTVTLDEALAKCRAGTDAAYLEAQKAFKVAVETLQAALKAAKTQAEALAALSVFEAQYKAISKAARDKALTACADLLKQTGDAMEKDDDEDEKESDDDKPKARAIPVTGKFNADGSVALSFKVRQLGTSKAKVNQMLKVTLRAHLPALTRWAKEPGQRM